MSRDRSKAIQAMLVEQLRGLDAGAKPHLGRIRTAIAGELGRCSLDELREAVLALRYAGKLHWDRLELSPSMLTDCGGDAAAAGDVASDPDTQGASGTAREAPGALPSGDATRGTARAPTNPSSAAAEPRCADEAPVGDDAPPVREPAASEAPPAPLQSTGKPSTALKRVRSASSHAGRRPIPAPRHESEVARAVRLEAESAGQRRRNAHIPSSRRSLDLVRGGPSALVAAGGLSIAEAVTTMLAEEPKDLITAIRRRHADLWDRIIVAARAAEKRPGELLYDALERGLGSIERDDLALEGDHQVGDRPFETSQDRREDRDAA